MHLSSLARVLLLSLLLLERARAAPLQNMALGQAGLWQPGGQPNPGALPGFGFDLGLDPFKLGINVGKNQQNQGAQGGQPNPGAQPGFGFNLGLKPFDLGIKVPGFGFNLGLGKNQQNQGAQGGQPNPGAQDPFNLGINVTGFGETEKLDGCFSSLLDRFPS
ncbi:41 kDa spicule matrix protein-like [Mauremys mutica]|uniref:41 kDa spicule matrix protein-like n=1 Tax=Mauremys mutica TaxID=74926 RepID=UPI001D1666C3|nr:41 kDa spicule matrix protein-like [Mauremys mutica]